MTTARLHLVWPWIAVAVVMPIALALGASGWGGDSTILLEIRLPRVLAALTGGAALGVAGAVVQALLRNPLAEPGIIGIAPMSAVAGALASWAGASALLGLGAGIIGALVAVALLLWWAGRTPPALRLILLGVGLNAVGMSTVALIATLGGRRDLAAWTLGTTTLAQPVDALALALGLVLALMLTRSMRQDIDVLGLGTRAALLLGVNVRRTILWGLTGAAVLTGIAVSSIGMVALLGLAAPALARALVGHDLMHVTVTSAGLGGLILVVADLVARTALAPLELPLASLVALVALPTFLIAARRVSTWT